MDKTVSESPSRFGKLEADVEVKAPADQFFEFFMRKTYQLSNVSPDKIMSCELIKGGDWGEEGSVIAWSICPNEVNHSVSSKELIEAVDYEKRSVTLKVIEGYIMQNYKSFKVNFHVTATATDEKEEGSSCVHLTLEYEKLQDEVPEPEAMVPFIVGVFKDIGAYLTTHAKQ